MKKNFSVTSDLSLVSRTSADVLAFLGPLKLPEALLFDLRLCLEEALINAMKHGNGLQKELPVDVSVEADEEAVTIQIDDRGKGFEVGKVADCTQGGNLLRGGGRGVHLIRQLMDEVKFNAKGNSIRMTKGLKKTRAKR